MATLWENACEAVNPGWNGVPAAAIATFALPVYVYLKLKLFIRKERFRNCNAAVVLQLLGTAIGLATLFIAFVLLAPSLKVMKLAEWTAQKDFWEYCWSKMSLNVTLGPLCTATLNTTLSAPPLHKRTVGVAFHRASRFTHVLDKTSNTHEIDIAPWVLLALSSLELILCSLLLMHQGCMYMSSRRDRRKQKQDANVYSGSGWRRPSGVHASGANVVPHANGISGNGFPLSRRPHRSDPARFRNPVSIVDRAINIDRITRASEVSKISATPVTEDTCEASRAPPATNTPDVECASDSPIVDDSPPVVYSPYAKSAGQRFKDTAGAAAQGVIQAATVAAGKVGYAFARGSQTAAQTGQTVLAGADSVCQLVAVGAGRILGRN